MNRIHHRNATRRGALLVAGICAQVAIVNSASAETSLNFSKILRPDEPIATVSLTDVLRGKVIFRVADTPPAKLEIFPAYPTEKPGKACTFVPVPGSPDTFQRDPADADCKILTSEDPLGTFKIRPEGGATSNFLAFDAPNYGGGPSIVKMNPFQFSPPKQPSECYVRNGSEWSSIPCTKKESLEASPELSAFMKNTQSRFFYASIEGTDGRVWYRVDIPSQPQASPVDAQFDLKAKCQEKLAQSSLEGGRLYAFCVDLRDPSAPDSILLFRNSTTDPFELAEDPAFVKVRAPMVVYAWHSPADCPIISDIGTEGLASNMFISKSAAAAESGPPGPSGCSDVVRRSIGMQKGTELKVEIKVKDITFKRVFVVEDQYHFAVRLGLGVSWSPLARELEARQTIAGTRYAAITDGAGDVPGLFKLETLVGVTYFRNPASNVRPEWRTGLHLGMGYLSAGGKTGINALSSLRIGVEGSYGVDFAMGLSFGINRHDRPKDGIRPDAPLPNGSTDLGEKSFGITPGFGLYLMMTPEILKKLSIGG